MNKRLIGYSTSILVLILISFGLIACGQEYDDPLRFRNPSSFTSYNPEAGYLGSERGYYRINPETILSDLEQSKTDVFTPLSEDPFTDVNYEVADIEISWTQAEFLKIASAVGQLVWDDPMDLNSWSVYSIVFEADCEYAPTGFRYARITYFKKTNGDAENYYETRLIAVDTHFRGVRWGNGARYPKSVGPWVGVDLSGDKITADDALSIADENGGKDVCLQDIHSYISADSSIYINHEWLVSYISSPSLHMKVDMETGVFEIVDNDTDQPRFPTLVPPDTSDEE